MMDLRSFLSQKVKKIKIKDLSKTKEILIRTPKRSRSFKVASLLVLLIITMASVQYAEAQNCKKFPVDNSPIEIPKKENIVAEVRQDTVANPLPAVSKPTPQVAVSKPAAKPAAKQEPKVATKPAPVSTRKPAASRPVPVSTPAPQISTALNASGILSQINYQRAANGLGGVSMNSQLSQAAYLKAKHMADNGYFAHTAPDGTNDFYFVNNSGYRWTSAGVNLAMGSFGDAKELVDAWMNSSGHRANILASYGKVVGIGIYGQYFVMVIAN